MDGVFAEIVWPINGSTQDSKRNKDETDEYEKNYRGHLAVVSRIVVCLMGSSHLPLKGSFGFFDI